MQTPVADAGAWAKDSSLLACRAPVPNLRPTARSRRRCSADDNWQRRACEGIVWRGRAVAIVLELPPRERVVAREATQLTSSDCGVGPRVASWDPLRLETSTTPKFSCQRGGEVETCAWGDMTQLSRLPKRSRRRTHDKSFNLGTYKKNASSVSYRFRLGDRACWATGLTRLKGHSKWQRTSQV